MTSINNFIKSCRNLTNGTLSSKDSDRLRSVTEQEMPARYRVAYPTGYGVYANATNSPETEHIRGLWHELVQHLTDLRYLSVGEFIAYRQRHGQILEKPVLLEPVIAATRRYVLEDKWFSQSGLLQTGATADFYWVHQHLAAVTERIGTYLTWDGSLEALNADVLSGEADPLKRSLAYRLRMLSTPEFPFPEKIKVFGQTHLPLLETFASRGLGLRLGKRGLAGSRVLWRAVTDVNELLQRRARHNKKLDAPLLYRIPPAGESEITVDFETANLALPKPRVNYFNQSRSKSLLKEARRWEGQRTDDLSTRLLQIKLWQINFYVGAIDGDWGEMSHRALTAFITEQSEIEGEGNELGTFNLRQRNVHSLLLPVNRELGIYLADFKRLTKQLTDIVLVAERVAEDEEAKLFSTLGTKLTAPNGALDRKVLAEVDVNGLYPPWRENHRRRVAYTRKGFLGRVLRGIGRVVRWLKNKVSAVLDEVGGVVFGLVKLLLGRVRTGIQRFFNGFRYLGTFLLGKPLYTVMPPNQEGTQLVFATKFQLDFDAISVAPAGFQPEDPARHAAHIRRMIRDMDYFIDTTIEVVRIIARLTNPRGWVWFAWQIGKALIKVLVRRQPNAATAIA